MADATLKVGADTRSAQRALGSLQKGLAAVVSVASVGAFAVAINRSMKAIDDLAKSARAIGLTSDALVNLRRSANLAGVGADLLQTSLMRLQNNIGEAFIKGTGPAADALKTLGLSARELSLLDTDQQLQRVAAALKEIPNAAQRAALGVSLLGRQAPRLLEAADNAQRLQQEMAAFGLTLTEVDTRGIEAANDAMSELGFIIDAIGKKFTAGLGPSVSAVVLMLREAGTEGKTFGDSIENTVSGFENTFAFVLNGFSIISRGLKMLANRFDVAFLHIDIGLLQLGRAIRSAPPAAIDFLILVFEKLSNRFDVVLMHIQLGLFSLADSILGAPVAAINKLIQGFNELTGTRFEAIEPGDMFKSLQQQQDNLIRDIRQADDDYNNLGMRARAPSPVIIEMEQAIADLRMQIAHVDNDLLNLGYEPLAGERFLKLLDRVKRELAATSAAAGVAGTGTTDPGNAGRAGSLDRIVQLQNQVFALSQRTTREQQLQSELLGFQKSLGQDIFDSRRGELVSLLNQKFELQEINSIAASLVQQHEKNQNSFGQQFETLKRLRDTRRDERAILEAQFQLTERINQTTLHRYDLEAAAIANLNRSLAELGDLRFAIIDAQDESINKELLLGQVEQQRLNLLSQGQIALHTARMQMEDEYFSRIQQNAQAQFQSMGFGTQAAMDMAQKRVDFEKKSDVERTQFGIQQAGQLFSELGKNNRALFAASKAMNIANAVMNTYAGATQALAAYPPPFGFIAAAAVVGMGLAQVATIRAQQYSGRALGGPVMSGQSFIVGERGPELFTPSTSGGITPNNQLGSDVININFNITANDPRGFDQLLAERRPMIVNMIKSAVNDRGNRSNL